MTSEQKEVAIQACNESILHWAVDIWVQLVMGCRVDEGAAEAGWLQWEETGEALPIGTTYCPLCALYNLDSGDSCPYCPLDMIGDCCTFVPTGSSYEIFFDNPTAENAINMILSIQRAREFVEDMEG